MYDIVLKNGWAVLPEGIVQTDIGIHDGRIQAIGHLEEPSNKIVDCTELWILPGFIDPHTHVHWPFLQAFTQDNFTQATKAAIYGGTTCIIDFALQKDTSARNAVSSRREEIENQIHCDVGLSLAITDPNELDFSGWADLSQQVLAFKGYMIYRNRGMMLDDGRLLQLMQISKHTNRLLTIHAENQSLHDHFLGFAQSEDPASPIGWAKAKPPMIEEEAIRRAMWLAKQVGIPIYFRHVSSHGGITAIREAQKDQPVYAETCPQYLTLDQGLYNREDGALWVMSPPLRNSNDRDALWDELWNGTVTTIGSDHCLFEPEQKRWPSFAQIPNGIPGVETRATVVWNEMRNRGIPHEQAVKCLTSVMSTQVAQTFGLYPRKGVITVDADADLAIFEASPVNLSPNKLHMGSSWSPFAEVGAFGRIRHTIVRGQLKILDGEWTDQEPNGKFITQN